MYFLAFFMFSMSSFLQDGATPADLTPAGATSSDYQVGPGDLLSIRVYGNREFNQSTRVSNSGRIHVPFVGVISVTGMTPVRIESEIARLLTEQQLINEPWVRVQVDEHRAQPVYILGELNAPGQFVISTEMYLLDLIGKAGGFLPGADDSGFLYRHKSAQPKIQVSIIPDTDLGPASPAKSAAEAPSASGSQASGSLISEEVITINFRELNTGTRPELNLRLQGGDVVYVPRRQPKNFFVIGDVSVPGAYTLPRSGELTATQAITYAGGPLATASNGSAFIMRRDAAGVRQSVPVDFSEIIKGKQADIPIQAEDIIFIPSSNVKSISVGLLNLVPRLIQQFLIF